MSMGNDIEVIVIKATRKLQHLLDQCERRSPNESSKRKLLETLVKLHKYSRNLRLSINSSNYDHRRRGRPLRDTTTVWYKHCDRYVDRSPSRRESYSPLRYSNRRESPSQSRYSDDNTKHPKRRSRSRDDRRSRKRSKSKSRLRRYRSRSESRSRHRPRSRRSIDRYRCKYSPERFTNDLRGRLRQSGLRNDSSVSGMRSSINSLPNRPGYANYPERETPLTENIHSNRNRFHLDGEQFESSHSGSCSQYTKAETFHQNTKVENSTDDNERQVSTRTDSNRLPLAVHRRKVEFTLGNQLKTDNLNVSNVFDKPTPTPVNNIVTDVRSKLSSLLKSALKGRTNNGEIASNGAPGQTGHHQVSPQSKEKCVDNGKTPKERSSIDLTIDDDVIRKITSKLIKSSSNDALKNETLKIDADEPCSSTYCDAPANIPFNIDSLKQAVATDKMIKDKCVSVDTTQQLYTETGPIQSSSVYITSINQSSHSKSQFSTYSEPNTQRDGSKTTDQQNTSTDLIKSSSKTTRSNLPITSMNSPIPSAKFLNTFRTPALPKNTNASNPFNKINIPVNQQNNKIVQRRSTVYTEKYRLPGKQSTPKVSPKRPFLGFGNFKIPKISKAITQCSTPTTLNDSNTMAATTTTNESTLQANVATTNVVVIDDDNNLSVSNEDAMNPQRNNHSTANPGDKNPPSRQENAMTTIRELMNTNQFVTLVELMGQMAQQVALKKCANEEGGSGSSSSMTGESNKLTTDPKQKTIPTKMTLRSRSLSPTPSYCETSVEAMINSGVVERPTFKNVDPQWHSLRKVLNCHVCYKPHGNSLVSHYVNKHPNSEVLISRLAPEAADCLRSGNGITKCKVIREKGDRIYEYHQFCYFCNVYKRMGRSYWINHMVRHTGYYTFKCNQCSRLFAEKSQHKCSEKRDLTKITQPQFKGREINAFVCNLCNYVRFHEHEIVRHLRLEHEDNSNNFQKIPFLTFPTVEGKYRRFKCSRIVDNFLEGLKKSGSGSECKTEDSDCEYESDDESDWESEGELHDDDDVKMGTSDSEGYSD